MTSKSELKTRIDQLQPELVKVLSEIVALPSVSSIPANDGDVSASADFVASLFSQIGLETQILQAKTDEGSMGKPAVVGRKIVDPDAPTVLLYAHHDVQPVGELDRWSKPPFELTIEGDRAFGRGSADCGIGIVVHYGSLLALGDSLGVNVTVFIEGEEEIGSPSFINFLSDYRDLLQADVIIVADSNNWTVDVPAITASLRGTARVDVTVKVLEHAVHSGMFGGPVLDAVTLASRLISTLHDEEGSVAVPGLGGEDTADVEWEEADYRRDASVVPGYKLAGRGDLASRVWSQPAISVIGMDARSVAESANTITPECKFRLSIRTVPGADPNESVEAVKEHLEKNAPFGAIVTAEVAESGPSYLADLNSPASRALSDALEAAWQTKPVNIGVGGSIPFISNFQQAFPEAQVLVTGVEDPASNAHSEDESASLKVLHNATLAETLFLLSLSQDSVRK